MPRLHSAEENGSYNYSPWWRRKNRHYHRTKALPNPLCWRLHCSSPFPSFSYLRSGFSSTPTNLYSSRVCCSTFSSRRYRPGFVCAHWADSRKRVVTIHSTFSLETPLLYLPPQLSTLPSTSARYRLLNHYMRARQDLSDGGKPHGATWKPQFMTNILLFCRWWRVGPVLGRLHNKFKWPGQHSTSGVSLQRWSLLTPHTIFTLLISSREPSCAISAKTVYWMRTLHLSERQRRWGRAPTSSLYICKLYIIHFVILIIIIILMINNQMPISIDN